MQDLWTHLMGGFATAASGANLMWAFIGCALGTAIGVLPGLGPALTVAMLLPITAQGRPHRVDDLLRRHLLRRDVRRLHHLHPAQHARARPRTMVTALEGIMMAHHGRAGAALATAAIGSFLAGTIATVLGHAVRAGCWRTSPSRSARRSTFCLMLIAFTTVSAVLGQSTLRGMTALFIGLAMGLVGMDQITGQIRYTGGVPELLDGIETVVVAVGLFAVGRDALRGAL